MRRYLKKKKNHKGNELKIYILAHIFLLYVIWMELRLSAHKMPGTGNSRIVIIGRIETHWQNLWESLSSLVLVLLDGETFLK